MSKLTDFLMKKPVSEIREELHLNTREGIKEFPFIVRAMSGEEFNDYSERCSNFNPKTGKSKFDTKKYNELVIINHCVEPNFKDAEMLKQAGCTLPEQFLSKFLLAGEIVELAQKISEISGFDKSIDEVKEEAKN